jgi:hypothetical protein
MGLTGNWRNRLDRNPEQEVCQGAAACHLVTVAPAGNSNHLDDRPCATGYAILLQ